MGIFKQVEKKRISANQQVNITLEYNHVYMVIIQNTYNKSCGYFVLTGSSAETIALDLFGKNNFFTLSAKKTSLTIEAGIVDGYIYIYSIG